MNYRVLREENFKVSKWTGGTTTELAIFPETGKYLQRNFIWRLSSATCQQEEADFSKLPDFDRVLLVLEGNAVLAHQDVRVARLNPLEQDRFDGGYSTKSFGKITDYNLMVAKGNQGFLEVITLDQTSQTPETEDYPEYTLKTQGYYCNDGYATVSINENMVMLNPGEQLIVDGSNDEPIHITVMGEGHLIRAQILYNYRADELGPTIIPKEKGNFKDFRTCIYLANTQFRGARFIFKQMKSQWYDEELKAAVKKIEQFFLPYFIAILGIVGISIWGMDHLEGIQWPLALAAWLLVDSILISPLIYFAAVPKPTAAHIKDIHNLTPYETKVLEKERLTNERVDRLLKKYKYSGRAVYDENGNRTDKTY